MNELNLFEALGAAEDVHVLSAGQRLMGTRRKMRPAKRIILGLAAAVVLMMALFTTAMAVDEDFREAVFQFLNISQPEQVPDFGSANTQSPVTEEEPIVVEEETVEIGAGIEARYVHAAPGHARNGYFLICTDEIMMNSGNHYDAYIEGGEGFEKLEEHSFSGDYTLRGESFHLEFEWADTPTGVAMTFIDIRVPLMMYNMSGSSESVLMLLRGAYGNYPVLMNLQTGEMTDVLAGTGLEELQNIYNAYINEDKTGLLLYCWEEPGGFYYVDLETKESYNMTELSGESFDAMILTDNAIACWVLAGDDRAMAKMGTYRAWAFDLDTMERREIFDSIPATMHSNPDALPVHGKAGIVYISGFNQTSYEGNMFAGSVFALGVDEDKQVYVIDMETGEQSYVPGLEWNDEHINMSPSPDGKKLLVWQDMDEMGVLDFDEKSYVRFERINENDSDDFYMYWFDNDQVIVVGETETYDGRHSDYYIYTLN